MKHIFILLAALLLESLTAFADAESAMSQLESPLTRKSTDFVSYQSAADPVVTLPVIQLVEKGKARGCRLMTDIAYLGETQAERADLYLPVAGEGPFPAILNIHGGGWIIGDKSWGIENAVALTSHGYAVFTINYLLGSRPKNGRITDKGAWPRNLLDCKTALRFMRKYARELHIDPDRIAVMGGSAGGHLALLTGLTAGRKEYQGGFYRDQPEHVSAIINLFGVTDIRVWGRDALFSDWDRKDETIQSLASPVDQVSEQSPPILTIHGVVDRLVVPDHAQKLDAAIKEKMGRHKMILLPEAEHGFPIIPDKRNGNRDLVPEIVTFLKVASARNLK